MKCDTCGREVKQVDRVVIKRHYNRTQAKALYNCPECFRRKEKARQK